MYNVTSAYNVIYVNKFSRQKKEKTTNHFKPF